MKIYLSPNIEVVDCLCENVIAESMGQQQGRWVNHHHNEGLSVYGGAASIEEISLNDETGCYQ